MSEDLLQPNTNDLFGITHHDKMQEAQREVDLRRRVYPRWVEDGKLTQAKASRHVAVMAAIVDDYALLAATHGPVLTVKPLDCRRAPLNGIDLVIEATVERPKDVPRRIDLHLPLNGYVATELARKLIAYCAEHAGDNWRRVEAAFEAARKDKA